MVGIAKATVSKDGATVTLTRQRWSETFRAAELPEKQAFYRHLGDRKGGRYLAFYAPVIHALDRAAKILSTYGPRT